MTDEPNAPETVATRAQLLDRIRIEWAGLQETLEGLDERQLVTAGPDGWAVKDHLAHLAHWEEYLVAVLEGGDGRAVLGLAPGEDGNETTVNAGLQRRDAALSHAEVRRLLADTHARVLARLETLDDAALQQHLDHIRGNTDEHFAEHRGWIRELAGTTT
jgi:hypothetical protein